MYFGSIASARGTNTCSSSAAYAMKSARQYISHWFRLAILFTTSRIWGGRINTSLATMTRKGDDVQDVTSASAFAGLREE
jgi:hypothetical protein